LSYPCESGAKASYTTSSSPPTVSSVTHRKTQATNSQGIFLFLKKNRVWSLAAMDRLKNCLPFKNLYSSHYSVIIKKILTRYLICNEVKKNASKA
jgi:hypothetical protein